MPDAPATVVRLSSDWRAETGRWRAVREICCRTANNGQPIAAERWPFFGRLWVEPYQKIFPEWTYVAETGGGVIGYLTGCPDSRTFARARFWRCALPLLLEIVRGRYPRNRDARRFVRELLRIQEATEQVFPEDLRWRVRRDYPAHLHMNVAEGWRGQGVGTKLMQTFLLDLGSAGVPGVHLYCGVDPVKFYLRQGFRKLGKVVFHDSVPVYLLGQRCNGRA